MGSVLDARPTMPIVNFVENHVRFGSAMVRLHLRVNGARGSLTLVDFHKARLGPPTCHYRGKCVWDRLPKFRLWVSNRMGIVLEISTRYPTSVKAWDALRAYKKAMFGTPLTPYEAPVTLSGATS
jgi:hypothetical protein